MKLNKLLILFLSMFLVACSKDDGPNGVNIINNALSTGSSGTHLLSDANFTKLAVEIAYVEGYAPTQKAIDNLKNFLNKRTYKPDGISVVTRALKSTGGSPYTNAELLAIENDNRTLFNTQGTIAVWILFLDGKSSEDSNDSVILGTAYRNTSMVIYEKTLREFGNKNQQLSDLESTVLMHEFGHLFGLTNLGTPMQTPHEDSENSKHCNNKDCLMYYATVSSGLLNLISGGSLPTFDANCLEDLKAIGGK